MNCGPSLPTLRIQWLCRTKLPHLNDIHQHGLKEGRTGKLPVKARAAFGASEHPLVPRVAASSATNAVNFSSACTMNRLRSPRCASAIQIVRPRESMADTQPQLQPVWLRLVSDDFPVVHRPLTDDSTPFAVQVCSVQAVRSLFGFGRPALSRLQ